MSPQDLSPSSSSSSRSSLSFGTNYKDQDKKKMGVWVLRYKLQRPRNEKGVMGFRTNWKEHEEKKMESLGQLEERERETLRQKVKSEK